MAEFDYVVRDLFLNHSGIIDIKEIGNIIKKYLEKKKYSVQEKEYTAKGKNLKYNLFNQKEVDDYYQNYMNIIITAGNMKEVKIKNKKLIEADLQIKIESWLEHDYEGGYEEKPLLKFFKTIYSRFVSDAASKHESNLKDDTYDLYNELKSYLNITKFQ
ncbi:hypothetical protein K8R47_02745 [archaeon]|nr:hypothetical protein [archaeon]